MSLISLRFPLQGPLQPPLMPQVDTAKDEGGGSASSPADGERSEHSRGGEERCQQDEHQRIEGSEFEKSMN